MKKERVKRNIIKPFKTINFLFHFNNYLANLTAMSILSRLDITIFGLVMHLCAFTYTVYWFFVGLGGAEEDIDWITTVVELGSGYRKVRGMATTCSRS